MKPCSVNAASWFRIGEVVSGLDDVLMPAIREASHQARRGFTLADQVHQLVTASEADPDMGFMARLMALCSLPRTNPGNQYRYVRRNGPYKLIMSATGDHKLTPDQGLTVKQEIKLIGEAMDHDDKEILDQYEGFNGALQRLACTAPAPASEADGRGLD